MLGLQTPSSVLVEPVHFYEPRTELSTAHLRALSTVHRGLSVGPLRTHCQHQTCFHRLHRPSSLEDWPGGAKLLCPAVTSLVLVLSVESRDCRFARPSFKLSHCFKALLRRFGALPHPSRVPVLALFLFRRGSTVSRVASHRFRSLPLLRSVLFVCGFPWVCTVGTCSPCLFMASTKIG